MSEKQSPIGRRNFLARTGVAAFSAALAGTHPVLASVPESSHSAIRLPDLIIDSHCHFGASDTWVNDMVSNYRPRNAMACTIAWHRDMNHLKEAIQAYPDVFIGYGRVSVDDPNAVREVASFAENGFKGIKFHSPQLNWDDPSYFQVYRLCEHLGLHMLFHTGISSRRSIDSEPRWGTPSRMRPMYLDTLCRQFPDATIQGAHFGNPWYDEAAEAARWNPNLFFDVTGSTLYKLILLGHLDRMSEYLWWSQWAEGQANPHTLQGGPTAWQHIVFGCDEAPAGLAGNIERFQMMLDVNNVPESDRADMWGMTMARRLGIDPTTRRPAAN